MEDVAGEVSQGQVDPGICGGDRRVSLSVFPCVYRQEQPEGRSKINIVISKAWVTIEAGEPGEPREAGEAGEAGDNPRTVKQ